MAGQGERVRDKAAAWGRRTVPPMRKGKRVPVDLESQNVTSQGAFTSWGRRGKISQDMERMRPSEKYLPLETAEEIRWDTGKKRPREGNRQAGVHRGRDRSEKVKSARHSLLRPQREDTSTSGHGKNGPREGQDLVRTGFAVLRIRPRHLWIGVDGYADCTRSTKPLNSK